MKGAPRSKEFDDVYFSAVDGLAETRHVFLDSNGLPQFFKDYPEFKICETGFGTGLNFLAVWDLFETHAGGDQRLHFISFEKYPLKASEIKEYLEPWRSNFPEKFDRLVACYPDLVEGRNDVELSSRVKLTLLIGDMNEMIVRLEECVHCWFLDGFKPSSNPDMWSETLFNSMARLSTPEAHFATFTAAGFVKRGLRSAGFEVKKVKGFGRKREMLCGTYKGIQE